MGSERRVVVIINPASGKDQPVLATLSDALGEAGRKWAARVTTGEGDALRYACEARDGGAERVLVYGGDGTVSAVASGLAGGDSVLAILPGGTGNAVAQELGIPTDLRAAVALALDPEARVAPVDALRVGDRRFLLRIGIGADALAVTGADREAKDRLGWLAYLSSALERVSEVELARFELDIDGRQVTLSACALILANIGRMGRAGMHLSHDIDPLDGMMDVLVVRGVDAASLLSVGASMVGITGATELPEGLPGEQEAELEDARLYHWRARRVSVRAEPDQPVHGDGDEIECTPLEVELEEGAVRLVLPPAPEEPG